MMKPFELGWLAGFLSTRRGNFGWSDEDAAPEIVVAHDDPGVVERAADMFGVQIYRVGDDGWGCRISGARAIEVMRELRPHMVGDKAKIIDALLERADLGA